MKIFNVLSLNNNGEVAFMLQSLDKSKAKKDYAQILQSFPTNKTTFLETDVKVVEFEGKILASIVNGYPQHRLPFPSAKIKENHLAKGSKVKCIIVPL